MCKFGNEEGVFESVATNMKRMARDALRSAMMESQLASIDSTLPHMQDKLDYGRSQQGLP
jgi:chemotaxis regulatin CheY-phosphate phosphatase CheZ